MEKKSEARDITLTVRVSNSDKQSIEKATNELRMSIAQFIRICIEVGVYERKTLIERFLDIKKKTVEECCKDAESIVIGDAKVYFDYCTVTPNIENKSIHVAFYVKTGFDKDKLIYEYSKDILNII